MMKDAAESREHRFIVPLALFLGIVLGHYIVTGIIWGLLSLFAPGLTNQYVVIFA